MNLFLRRVVRDVSAVLLTVIPTFQIVFLLPASVAVWIGKIVVGFCVFVFSLWMLGVVSFSASDSDDDSDGTTPHQ